MGCCSEAVKITHAEYLMGAFESIWWIGDLELGYLHFAHL